MVDVSDDLGDVSDVLPTHRRTIRSFVRRAGRVSPAQERGLQEGLPIYGIPFSTVPINVNAIFERSAPVVLEIGFGMGDATADIAASCPHLNFIGVEVHVPGVGSLLNQIRVRSLSNVKVIQHDAVEVLEYMISPCSLYGVHLFFPDPWHKTRHNKRRIVQPRFVEQLVRCLRSDGYLHFATDWEPYAQWMLEVLEQNPKLKNAFPEERFAPRPDYRLLTKFEKRGMRLGHGVWDLIFKL